MGLTVSVYLKEETLARLREKLRQSNSYRNKSHLVECAIENYLEKEQ
ncbi:MAG: ribbon-helix-helix domain-containing protein [Nanoarchaeota archaeon]|nr:ribbon-helix-helix domain-containing protein [Nanoarchaeota archaeon]